MYKTLPQAKIRNRSEDVVILEHIKKLQSAAEKTPHGKYGTSKKVFDYRRLFMM